MLIYAHRGASGEFPENTLAAFDAAVQQQADGIELDVFEVDGELVIYHDRYLDKLGYPDVCLLGGSLQELRELNIPQERAIPTLQEALIHIDGRCKINIDIKHLVNVELLFNCLEEVAKRSQTKLEHIILSSFDHPLLMRIRIYNEKVKLGVILASIPLEYHSIIHDLKPFSLHLDVNCLDQNAVCNIKDLGLPVYIYTVDKLTDIIRLKCWGVDGIFSNYPKRSREYLATII